MIDRQVFADGIGQLGGAFGREIDGPVTRMYYAVLSPRLSSEQFVEAVTKTVAGERFWPSPAVILEYAGADADTLAQVAFRTVADTLNAHGGYRFLPAEISTAWDAQTWAGIKAIGGLREITECSEQRWPTLVKRFCKAYQEALSPRSQLQDHTPAKVKAIVGDTTRQLTLMRGGQDQAVPKGDRE